MKKIRILGIAPYQGLVTLMNQCALQYPEIELTAISGNMEHGYAIAKRSYDQYDIIISRANTANMISQAVPIPVIDIGIGYYRCTALHQNGAAYTNQICTVRFWISHDHCKKSL